MTTPNGHHQVDVFEGVELPPDAETQALLELMRWPTMSRQAG